MNGSVPGCARRSLRQRSILAFPVWIPDLWAGPGGPVEGAGATLSQRARIRSQGTVQKVWPWTHQPERAHPCSFARYIYDKDPLVKSVLKLFFLWHLRALKCITTHCCSVNIGSASVHNMSRLTQSETSCVLIRPRMSHNLNRPLSS